MFRKICLILLVISSLKAITVNETINQRNLFEKQKETFKEKEKQKSEEILHYDIKKPKIEKIDGGKCFEIKTIDEIGFSLLSSNDKTKVYNKYLGKCNTLTDIKNLINELTTLYIDKGYITSKVYLKQQNIKKGILTLFAVEGKIEDISAKNLYTKNVFFGLKDDYLNLRDLEVGIENINRLPSNNAKLNLKPGTKAGLTIVDIENESSFPINGYISYNNYGSNPTGKHQIGLNVNIDNPLGFNDLFSINYKKLNK